MIGHMISVRHLMAAASLVVSFAVPALAQEMRSREDIYKEIEGLFGAVPTFVQKMPDAALEGSWLLERDLELSDKTALDAKTKALISLAVAAQIPCQYCIWADTHTLQQMGATEAEIGEAIAMGGLTRYYSTLFNGMQLDFAQFKKELGGE